ncbi:MAG: MBL fold metallo-hydrolase [Anaerolineaceae bacterium]|nr:MAG: MBL fold metallo-hydrolase [Anaerolineaceae bacterium]
MDLKVEFTYKKYENGIIAITAPMKEQIYLVKGKEKALLIDNGMGIGSLRKYVNNLCDLPLMMINTHGHPDHAGGNIEFEHAYMHPSDFELYQQMCTKEFRTGDIRAVFQDSGALYESNLLDYVYNLLPIEEGDTINLGDRCIDIYSVPGHTYGSLVLYDNKSKTIFTGDTIGIGDTWLYLEYCASLKIYCNSLERLKDINLDISMILSGHMPNESRSDLLNRKIDCVKKIISGKEIGKPVKTFAGEGLRYEYEGTSIIYNPENIF